jgi:hypothetical protein
MPTLFLSECVLVYLEPEESCSIIAWAAQSFSSSVFVTYEQVRPHDAFGQIMARNLAERGYNLRGLNAFPDIASQRSRYLELGYTHVTVADMNDVYYNLLDKDAIARAERLELFDEVEEWHLMSAHYCIAVACKDINEVLVKAEHSSGTVALSNSEKVLTNVVQSVYSNQIHSNVSMSQFSPNEATKVAAAVVHSHEVNEASYLPQQRRASRQYFSPEHSNIISPQIFDESSSFVSPSILPNDLRLAANAFGAASGTHVDSVELSTTLSENVNSLDIQIPPKSLTVTLEPTSSRSFSAPDSFSNERSSYSSGTSFHSLHTHAGNVVLSTHSPDVNFAGIADAQDELGRVGGLREASGLNIQLQRARVESFGGTSQEVVNSVSRSPGRRHIPMMHENNYSNAKLVENAASGYLPTIADILFPKSTRVG